MRRNQIAQQTKEIFDDLGVEIGIQQEILDLEPPMIGEIRKAEELVAVTNEGVTEVRSASRYSKRYNQPRIRMG